MCVYLCICVCVFVCARRSVLSSNIFDGVNIQLCFLGQDVHDPSAQHVHARLAFAASEWHALMNGFLPPELRPHVLRSKDKLGFARDDHQSIGRLGRPDQPWVSSLC